MPVRDFLLAATVPTIILAYYYQRTVMKSDLPTSVISLSSNEIMSLSADEILFYETLPRGAISADLMGQSELK